MQEVSKMFDNNKNHDEFHEETNTQNEQEIGHYEYHKEAPKQPQDHKKKKMSSAKCTGIAAAVALMVGVIAGAGLQMSGNMANRVEAASQSSGSQIEQAGTVNDKKSGNSGDFVNVSQEETETSSETETAADEVQTAETVSDADGSAASGNTVADVAENSMPFMVAITTTGVEEVQSYFSGQTYDQQFEGAGTGVIFDENEDELLVVTNNHVIENADTLSVCFSADLDDDQKDDAVVEGLVKGTDSSHDIAVVAVKLADIPDDVKSQIRIASIGDSTKVKLGEQVVAIGNALGYGQSVTSGYVSALNREITVEGVTNSMIQTDAAINAGNSGGALLNMNGEVIGINSAKASASGVEGMGYAIPTEDVKPILDNLKNVTTRTKVTDSEDQGFMGITPYDISDEAKQLYGVPAGAYVYEVQKGSAAEEAGIVTGDIITKIDGVTISSRSELFDRMEYYRAGEEVTLTVEFKNDNGAYEEKEVTLTLGSRNEAVANQNSQNSQNNGGIDNGNGNNGNNGGNGNGNNDGNSDSVSPFSQMFPDLFN